MRTAMIRPPSRGPRTGRWFMKSMICISLAVIAPVVFLASGTAHAQMRLFDHDIDFSGTASGGVLTFVELFRNSKQVSIVTEPGESAASVADKLAAAISDQFGWYSTKKTEGGSVLKLAGSRLCNALAGTERGLGIPRPPTSLTWTYDEGKDRYRLQWINAPGGYDSIGIGSWHRDGAEPTTFAPRELPGDATSYSLGVRNLGEVDLWVIGFRGTVPSNAAPITITREGQEELMTVPFTDGVAPNWTAWSWGEDKAIACTEGEKWDYSDPWKGWNGRRGSRSKLDRKRIYQALKVSTDTGVGGVFRKFVGLVPGHTYRVSARLNTLDTPPDLAGWTLTLHAAPNAGEGTDLTVSQLSGAAALPNGDAGAAAGQIALFGPDLTTDGKWEMKTTGQPGLGAQIGDITLPQKVNTLTVWLRLSGPKGASGALDWIKLEDLSRND